MPLATLTTRPPAATKAAAGAMTSRTYWAGTATMTTSSGTAPSLGFWGSDSPTFMRLSLAVGVPGPELGRTGSRPGGVWGGPGWFTASRLSGRIER